jgi:hypothetical protein
MKAKIRFILEESIERGIRGGLLNNDSLSYEYSKLEFLVDNFTQRVMNEIDEYFTFGENDD